MAERSSKVDKEIERCLVRIVEAELIISNLAETGELGNSRRMKTPQYFKMKGKT
jgi:hypothetical protein